MTAETLFNILKQAGLPTAYRAFMENEEDIFLPLIVFEESEPNVFAADGVPYYVSPVFEVELQNYERDLDIERTLENVLLSNELFFKKGEPFYNDGEKFYSITYRIEV